MGVLGHLTKEERESLWETFEKKLKTGTPVLIGVLNKKFLSVPIGTPISIAQQGNGGTSTDAVAPGGHNSPCCYVPIYPYFTD